MLVETDLDMAGYSGDTVATMQQRMIDAMRAIPGVSAAGHGRQAPLAMGWSSNAVFKENVTDLRLSNAAADAMRYDVSPGYIRAAGTVLLAGRTFTCTTTRTLRAWRW